MKKIIIGAIVGGILIFIWQALSWTVLDLHRAANQYTPKQEEVMTYLNSQFNEDGSYFIPTYPPGSSNEVIEQSMKAAEGKPWAVVTYHKEFKTEMGMNMLRGLLVNILMVALFCWIISGFANPRFSNVFVAAILVGLISFIQFPYIEHIWFEIFDLSAHLVDSIAGWGLVGLWLGWWYGRRPVVAK